MKKGRLSDFDRHAIIKIFNSMFVPGDHLWLFGSRADMTRKGGDIDLFIESSLPAPDLYQKKLDFIGALWNKIGEQKIDVTTYNFGEPSRPIHEEARQTGIRLTMTTLEKLKSEIEICDIHADRLSLALTHIERFSPLTPEKLETLKDEDLAFLDLMSNRFSKLQDTIGRKIFLLLLQVLNEHEARDSFIDRLHKLEKLEILEDSSFPSFWEQMRKVRNEIAHDYPDSSEQIIEKLERCFEASHALLAFWENLKKIIVQRTSNIKSS